MAAVTHGGQVYNTTWNAAGQTANVTPAVGDLLVAFVCVTGQTATDWVVSDNQTGGTWTKIRRQVKASSADILEVWVRDNLCDSTNVHACKFSHASGNATGGFLVVERISGMSLTGSSAVRSQGGQDNQASGTPSITLSNTALTGNVVLTGIASGTSTPGLTVPTNFTQRSNSGYSTPTTGGQVATRDSGHTSSTVAWGSSSATAFCSVAVELDTSVVESVPQGGAVAQGLEPAPNVPAPSSGAVAQGVAPAASIAVNPGGALASGYAPTEDIGGGGGVSETPTPGGALAGGASPTVLISVSAGGALAAGTAPTALATVPQGGAFAQGTAPAVSVVTSQGGALAQGTGPAPARVTFNPGGATAGGFAPSEPGEGISETPIPGGAVASGFGATVRVTFTIGGATAGGFTITEGAVTALPSLVSTQRGRISTVSVNGRVVTTSGRLTSAQSGTIGSEQ